MFDFQAVNYWDKLLTLLIAILQAGLIWLIVKGGAKMVMSVRVNQKRLKNSGIIAVNGNSSLNNREMIKLLKEAETIKICVVNGVNILQNLEEEFASGLNKGKRLQVLVCNPASGFGKEFLREIKGIESAFMNRKADFADEYRRLGEVYSRLLLCGDVEIKCYRSLYRMPVIVGCYGKETGDKIVAFTNHVVPPRFAKQAFFLKAVADEAEIERSRDADYYARNVNMAIDCNNYFDYVWKNAEDFDAAAAAASAAEI